MRLSEEQSGAIEFASALSRIPRDERGVWPAALDLHQHAIAGRGRLLVDDECKTDTLVRVELREVLVCPRIKVVPCRCESAACWVVVHRVLEAVWIVQIEDRRLRVGAGFALVVWVEGVAFDFGWTTGMGLDEEAFVAAVWKWERGCEEEWTTRDDFFWDFLRVWEDLAIWTTAAWDGCGACERHGRAHDFDE